MKYKKIKRRVKSGLKPFLLSLAVRIVWSASMSSLLILILVLVARVMGTTKSIVQILSESFIDLFVFFFIICFLIFFVFYVFSIVEKWEWEPRSYSNLKKRFRRISLETRRLLAYGFKWTARFAFLMGFVDLLMLIRETYVGDESFFRLGFSLYVILFFVFSFSIGFSNHLMNPFDWTIFHLERFRKYFTGKVILTKELMRALANYNRILGSTLPMKRLVAISRCTAEAYKIGRDEDKKDIDEKIDDLIKSLKNKKVSEANGKLIALSESALKITEQHENVLGFEVKYPLRYKVGDALRVAIGRVFTHFMLFLLWVLILIVLAYLGLLPSFPPSPPF